MSHNETISKCCLSRHKTNPCKYLSILKSNHFTVTVQHNHAEAVENSNQPRVLLGAHLSDVNKEVSINLLSIVGITRTISRKKKNKKGHPTISKQAKAEDLILSVENITLSNEESFLFYDSISNTINNNNDNCETDDEENNSLENIENVNDNCYVRY
uniref:FLYWCH-type domain-containing protein n=1 Tax=Strongyloides venezuelensis TaxID=75913 RepID=A0A0K0FR77_STRVS